MSCPVWHETLWILNMSLITSWRWWCLCHAGSVANQMFLWLFQGWLFAQVFVGRPWYCLCCCGKGSTHQQHKQYMWTQCIIHCDIIIMNIIMFFRVSQTSLFIHWAVDKMHNVLCHVVTFCRETGSDLNIQEEQCRQGNWKEGAREGLVVDYVRISLLWLISGARSLSHTHSLSLSLSLCAPLLCSTLGCISLFDENRSKMVVKEAISHPTPQHWVISCQIFIKSATWFSIDSQTRGSQVALTVFA